VGRWRVWVTWAQISGVKGSSANDCWHQKTRAPVLSRGVVCVILCLAVLIQYRRVTDRQTDRHTHTETDMQTGTRRRLIGLPAHSYRRAGNTSISSVADKPARQRTAKILNSHVTITIPFCGWYHIAVIDMFNPQTKFEVPTITCKLQRKYERQRQILCNKNSVLSHPLSLKRNTMTFLWDLLSVRWLVIFKWTKGRMSKVKGRVVVRLNVHCICSANEHVIAL